MRDTMLDNEGVKCKEQWVNEWPRNTIWQGFFSLCYT